jgi:hypothetical protein
LDRRFADGENDRDVVLDGRGRRGRGRFVARHDGRIGRDLDDAGAAFAADFLARQPLPDRVTGLALDAGEDDLRAGGGGGSAGWSGFRRGLQRDGGRDGVGVVGRVLRRRDGLRGRRFGHGRGFLGRSWLFLDRGRRLFVDGGFLGGLGLFRRLGRGFHLQGRRGGGIRLRGNGGRAFGLGRFGRLGRRRLVGFHLLAGDRYAHFALQARDAAGAENKFFLGFDASAALRA